jgi:hypothetical protein
MRSADGGWRAISGEVEQDNDAFGAWCVAHGVECVRVLGISDFRAA